MNSSASIVLFDGSPRRSRSARLQRAVEPALARDHDPFGRVPQHGIRGAAKRSPRAAAGRAFALAPHDLAAQQQPKLVLENADDVGGEAAIRLAAEVRDVDGDAPARLELARALGEHVGEELEILDVRARHSVSLELLFVLLAREVGR